MPPGSVRCVRSLVVLLFFLLAPVTPGKPAPPGLPHHCKDEQMACFVNYKCVNPNKPEKMIDDLEDGQTCDVHMEIRPYSNKKALIRLKTKTGQYIKFYFKATSDVEVFGCKIEGTGKDKKVVHSGGTELTYGSFKDGLACEFLYEADPVPASDTDPVLNLNDEYVLEYAPNSKAGGGSHTSYMQKYRKCDMDWLDNSFAPDEKFLYTVPDRRFSTVTCETGELVYDDDTTVHVAGGGISCVPDPSDPSDPPTKYFYEFKEKDDASPVQLAAPSKVACRSIACKQCSTTAPACPTSAPGCTAPTLAAKDGCDVFRCASGIVAVNGGAPTLGELTCKPLTIKGEEGAADRTVASWTFGGAAVTSVECKDTVSCKDANPLKAEAGIDLAKPPLTCADQKAIEIDGVNQTDAIQCNQKTGDWFYQLGGEKISVAKGASLSCAAVESTTEAVAGASMGTMEFAAIGGGAVIIIIVVILIVFCFVIKPRRKREAAKRIKTITSNTGDSKSTQENLKTALPLGVPPGTGSSTGSPDLTNHPFTPAPELVEKTMIAASPSPASKQGQTVNTAVGNTATTDPTDKVPSMIEGAVKAHVRHPDDVVKHIPGDNEFKKAKRGENGEIIDEDMSEPHSIKIGKDGNVLPPKRKSKHTKVTPLPEDEEGGKSKSEADPTKKDDKRDKPADNGPKPQEFPLNEKEEKIRRGATVKMAEYPTLAEIESDWEDKPDKEGKKEKTKGKTVPSAMTPEVPPSVDRTQNNNTRNTIDKNDPELENLVTQLDTTVEQKEAEKRKKK